MPLAHRRRGQFDWMVLFVCLTVTINVTADGDGSISSASGEGVAKKEAEKAERDTKLKQGSVTNVSKALEQEHVDREKSASSNRRKLEKVFLIEKTTKATVKYKPAVKSDEVSCNDCHKKEKKNKKKKRRKKITSKPSKFASYRLRAAMEKVSSGMESSGSKETTTIRSKQNKKHTLKIKRKPSTTTTTEAPKGDKDLYGSLETTTRKPPTRRPTPTFKNNKRRFFISSSTSTEEKETLLSTTLIAIESSTFSTTSGSVKTTGTNKFLKEDGSHFKSNGTRKLKTKPTTTTTNVPLDDEIDTENPLSNIQPKSDPKYTTTESTKYTSESTTKKKKKARLNVTFGRSIDRTPLDDEIDPENTVSKTQSKSDQKYTATESTKYASESTTKKKKKARLNVTFGRSIERTTTPIDIDDEIDTENTVSKTQPKSDPKYTATESTKYTSESTTKKRKKARLNVTFGRSIERTPINDKKTPPKSDPKYTTTENTKYSSEITTKKRKKARINVTFRSTERTPLDDEISTENTVQKTQSTSDPKYTTTESTKYTSESTTKKRKKARLNVTFGRGIEGKNRTDVGRRMTTIKPTTTTAETTTWRSVSTSSTRIPTTKNVLAFKPRNIEDELSEKLGDLLSDNGSFSMDEDKSGSFSSEIDSISNEGYMKKMSKLKFGHFAVGIAKNNQKTFSELRNSFPKAQVSATTGKPRVKLVTTTREPESIEDDDGFGLPLPEKILDKESATAFQAKGLSTRAEQFQKRHFKTQLDKRP